MSTLNAVIIQEEVQVLEAIYADTFRTLSATATESACFEITLEECGVRVTFALPEEYPEVVPKVSIDATTSRLDTIGLTKLVLKEAEGMTLQGEPMCFNLIAVITDNLDSFKLACSRLETNVAQDQQEPQYTTIETRQIEEGTSITRESFLKWHHAFIKECDPDAFHATTKTSKLTGRQLFEQKIISVHDDEGMWEEDEDAFDMSTVDAALFVGLEDLESLEGSDCD